MCACTCIYIQHYKSIMLLLFSHSVVSDSATPWTTACQASLSFTVSWSLLRFTSIESVMLPGHSCLAGGTLGFFPAGVTPHKDQAHKTPW